MVRGFFILPRAVSRRRFSALWFLHNRNPEEAALLPTTFTIARELRYIACKNWQGAEHWERSDEGILGGDRVRQLGEQADRAGGFRCMAEAVHEAFMDENDCPQDDICAAAISEINFRWSGIGDWQS